VQVFHFVFFACFVAQVAPLRAIRVNRLLFIRKWKPHTKLYAPWVAARVAVSSGQWPDETGGSPVPPLPISDFGLNPKIGKGKAGHRPVILPNPSINQSINPPIQ
jgi:hypothetical protein